MEKIASGTPRLYNTPVEVGLRCLIILRAANKIPIDMDKIMYFDFISLNTFDFSGPKSLHAPIQNRGVQIYSRRELVKRGLAFLLSKDLVHLHSGGEGFLYLINDLGIAFLTYFSSNYFKDYTERTIWTVSTFQRFSTNEIRQKLTTSLLTWGAEFATDDNLTGTV